MENPCISVIIPSYNHASYIGQAIESVLSQSFKSFELLIADDCSTDNSIEIIKKFSDSRIRTFFLERNLGAVPILDFLINEAKGDYIALLNSDDFWYPSKLEKQYEIMQKKPDLGASFTWANIVDENGRVLSNTDVPYAEVFIQRNKSQGEWLNHFFYNSNCLCHPSILIKRTIFEEIGSYKHYLRQIPDFELWIRLIKSYPIYIHEERLVAHRRHFVNGENASADTLENAIRGGNEMYLVFDSFFNDMKESIFIEGFSELFRNKNAISHEDMLCEQAFLLKNNRLNKNVFEFIALKKLADLLQNKKTREILSVQFGFTHSDYFNMTSTKGIGYLDLSTKLDGLNLDKIIVFLKKNNKLYAFLKKKYINIKKNYK